MIPVIMHLKRAGLLLFNNAVQDNTLFNQNQNHETHHVVKTENKTPYTRFCVITMEMSVQMDKRAADDLEPRLNGILHVIKHVLLKEQLDILEFRRL